MIVNERMAVLDLDLFWNCTGHDDPTPEERTDKERSTEHRARKMCSNYGVIYRHGRISTRRRFTAMNPAVVDVVVDEGARGKIFFGKPF